MPACTADFTSLRFSTRAIPDRMRIPMWREEFGRCVVHVDIEPSSGVPFRVEATLQALPGLRTLAWQGSAMRFKRSHTNIADGDDSLFCDKRFAEDRADPDWPQRGLALLLSQF